MASNFPYVAHGKGNLIDVKLMILTGDRGRRVQVDYFRHRMIAASPSVEGLAQGLADGGTATTTHGLRYAAAIRLYRLWVSFDDIASIAGHETAAMVKKYAGKKRKAKLAVAILNAATEAQKRTEVTNPARKATNRLFDRIAFDVWEPRLTRDLDGGRSRTRTYDPLIKSQLLYQLSYAPGPKNRGDPERSKPR
jgi:hypothetical protein